ncbi:MAG: hypothetical protein QXO80_02905 [Thermosphaera sp.]
MSENVPQQTGGDLEALVKTFTFEPINVYVHLFPGIFITGFLLTALMSILEITSLNIGLITASSVSSFMIGAMLASGISSYILLDRVLNHLYISGVATYYFVGGNSFVAGLYYLKNRLSKNKLPSPATGLILSLMTMGLAYPVILSLVEKTLRDHMIDEEEVLLKQRVSPYYYGERLLIDVALTFFTLGMYLIYQPFRVVKSFNAHIELIHSSHPNPPSTPKTEQTRVEVSRPTAFFLGTLIVFGAMHGVLGYLGIPSIFIMYYGVGLLWSFLNYRLRSLSRRRLLLMNFLIIYFLIIFSTFIGILGYRIYGAIFEGFMESAETLRNATIHELSMRIFFNNAGIALASIVPFIGTIPMTMGVGNAGVLIGAIIPERLAIGDYTPLLIYIMPHAILELLAYSFFVTSAFELKTSRALRLIIVGLLTLGLAAVVEALSIKILG